MDSCEVGIETINILTRKLLAQKEDVVVRELGHPALKFGGEFLNRNLFGR